MGPWRPDQKKKKKRRSVKLLYITFLHSVLSNLVLYPEELDPEIFYFQWPVRTKIERMYQNILKEDNVDHNFLRCSYLQEKNFEVMHSEIVLDKVDLECQNLPE